MSSPRPETLDYIARCLPGAAVTALAGDASTRNFYRLVVSDGSSRVLMEYPGPFEAPTDDMRMGAIFRAASLPVAAILESSPGVGCLLLEDLGDRTLESVLIDAGSSSDAACELLRRAVLLAVNVAERGTPALAASDRAEEPALDSGRFRFEMDYFLEHFAEGLQGVSVGGDLRESLHSLADRAAESPRDVLCHRDFHSRNLMVRADGSLAMVDIQDARRGPDTYDLASILRDAYVDFDPSWVEELAETYRTSLAEPPDRASFFERLSRVSAQRMLKALGTFGFQVTRMRRERYSSAIPRTQARLRDLLGSFEESGPLLDRLTDAGLL